MPVPELISSPPFLVAAAVILGGTAAVLFLTRRQRHTRQRGRSAAPSSEMGPSRSLGRTTVEHGTAGGGGTAVASAGMWQGGVPTSDGNGGWHRSAAGPSAEAEEKPAPPPVTFADVAGLDDAIAELAEVREYLSDPERFRSLGAELPRGILLHGVPGCGKTLLGRALAGETGVPFQYASAASFVERFVGTGAARVRELFEEARAHAPSILFIDELDAIGRRRNDDGGGDREYDHTLNQLLIELDGFHSASGVLIVGATNRPELIDPALMRPGRFDRRVRIELPDRRAREQILRLYAAKRPFSSRLDWDQIAADTAGLSAAELANILNEAALLAARRYRQRIAPEDVDEATDRVLAGTRSTRLLSHEEKRLVAVHEAGHALLTLLVRGMKPPSRVSMVDRATTVDWSIWSEAGDRDVLTKHELLAKLIVLLGGRAAELVTFGEPSTRAEDDLENAASLARRMVERWAMTGRFELADGPEESTARYLEGSASAQEVRKLVSQAEAAARTILSDHFERLKAIAAALYEHETLSASELMEIGRPPSLPSPTSNRAG